MYTLSNGTTFLVQQLTAATPGTSMFDGSDYGRASLALFGGGAANGRLWFRAKRYGAATNSLFVALINPGGNYPATTVTLNGAILEVRLRCVSGAITATAKNVADAVNAISTYAFPIVADYDRSTGGDALVSAVSSTALTGGVNPRIEAASQQFKWDLPINVNGGFFYFEQDVPVVIRQMGARFPTIAAPTLFQIWQVNLTPGLGLYEEAVPVFQRTLDVGDADNIGFSDARIPLLPYQALYVECALPGIINFHVRPDSRMPYP